ncbi:hypothetical protein ACFQX8_09760 [Klenkia terrae]|uniref:hypothetical protein n=1 Tax=Klenkia terrae TaxID=1052259 RepID=UPI0036103FEF
MPSTEIRTDRALRRVSATWPGSGGVPSGASSTGDVGVSGSRSAARRDSRESVSRPAGRSQSRSAATSSSVRAGSARSQDVSARSIAAVCALRWNVARSSSRDSSASWPNVPR